MKTIVLDTIEERASGFTHLLKIDYTDISTAATTKAITLVPGLAVGALVRDAAFYLKTPFDGGASLPRAKAGLVSSGPA